jgi:outer membrane protein OmpA-like peptidoglycan-associated protein
VRASGPGARRRWAACAFAGALLATASPAGAQRRTYDPDAPETQKAAIEALPHARRLEITSTTRQIVGVSRGVDALLKDLNAQVRGREVRIALAADVLFDFDKASLGPEAPASLQKVADVLKQYPKGSARVEGHTDGKGDAAYNQKLSERRAETVRKWLTDNGVAMKLVSKGWGKTKPIAPNTRPDGKDDPEGRKKNRRVEIAFTR